MRSAFRLFMASIVLTVAAGFATAQESSEPSPPPAPETAVPDAAVPVVELPPLPIGAAAPVQDPNAPAVDPALTIDPSVLAVAPAAVAIVQAPESEIVVPTTTTRRVTKKTAKQPVEKPVEKPLIEATEAFGPMPAKASVAAASTAPASSNAPPPAAKSVIVETPVEKTEPRTVMGIGGWLLAGIVVAAMVSLITLLRRRRTQRKTSIVEFPAFAEFKPVPVTRN
jgi:hypothetical protein